MLPNNQRGRNSESSGKSRASCQVSKVTTFKGGFMNDERWAELLEARIDLQSSMVERLAASIVKKEDDLIKMVLVNRGVDVSDLEALKPRLKVIRRHGDTYQTLYLDGEAILELHDVTMSHHDGKMTSKLQYREFDSSNPC